MIVALNSGDFMVTAFSYLKVKKGAKVAPAGNSQLDEAGSRAADMIGILEDYSQ